MKKVVIDGDEYNIVEFVLLAISLVSFLVVVAIFVTDSECTLVDGCSGNRHIGIALFIAIVCFLAAFCVRVLCEEDR